MFVAMTTAPRPQVTVHDSISSLRHTAKYTGPLVVLDDSSGERKRYVNVSWNVNSGKLGPLINWHAALDLGLETGLPYIVLLEDDILWARDAWAFAMRDIATLHAHGMDTFLYSMFSSYTVTKPLVLNRKKEGRLEPGLYSMAFNNKAGGSQAWCLTRSAAQRLLEEPGFVRRLDAARAMPFDPTLRGQNMNSDRDNQVSAALMRQGVPVMYRIPSLCHHDMGSANSSYWTKKEQDTVYFEDRPTEISDVYL